MQQLTHLTLFALLLCSKLAWASGYDMKDLEFLSKEGNSNEYLKHALDVRPSLRNESWEQMTQEMGRLHLERIIKSQELDQKNYDFINSLAQWPVFKVDRPFNILRESFLLAHFEKCLISKEERARCLLEIENYYDNSDKNVETTVKIYRLVKNHAQDTWKYLQHITKSSQSILYCKDEDVQQAVIQKIFTDRKQLDDQKGAKAYLNKVMDQECWSVVHAKFKEYLTHPHYEVHHQSFLFLSSLNELTQLEKDSYYLFFILNGPVNGETFNLAWANLLELSENNKRRELAVNELLKIDPLPGRIFALPDVQRKRIIVDYLKRTVPDYLDAYARACVDYREGQRVFPNGNPTLECNELMSEAKDQKWVRESLIIRFSGIKKRLQPKK